MFRSGSKIVAQRDEIERAVSRVKGYRQGYWPAPKAVGTNIERHRRVGSCQLLGNLISRCGVPVSWGRGVCDDRIVNVADS